VQTAAIPIDALEAARQLTAHFQLHYDGRVALQYFRLSYFDPVVADAAGTLSLTDWCGLFLR